MAPTREPQLDTSEVAADLRLVLGRLVRRLRAEHRFPISHGVVLGRLDREGPQSTSDLAAAERVRPQSMAQTLADLESDGLITRRPDLEDRRRTLIELSDRGRAMLERDRSHRVGWLAGAIDEELSPSERRTLQRAVGLIDRLADAEPGDAR